MERFPSINLQLVGGWEYACLSQKTHNFNLSTEPGFLQCMQNDTDLFDTRLQVTKILDPSSVAWVHLKCWLISSFIPLSTILWSKQWNKTLQKPSSSATPFDISTTYSVLTMWTLEIASAQFTRRNWNLRTHPHHLLKCVILTKISRLAT